MCEMQKLRVSVEQILTAAAEEICAVLRRSMAQIEEKLGEASQSSGRRQQSPEEPGHADVLIPPEGRSLHVDQEDLRPPHIIEDQEEEWISQEGEQTMKLILLSECPTHNQKLWMVKEELPLEQQDWSPSLDQVDPEPPHTKVEENLWTSQEGEQLQGLEEAAVTKFPSTPPHVKSEYDEDEAQSSQLHLSQTEETKEEPEDGDDYGGSEPDRIQNKDVSIIDVACKPAQHQSTANDKTCTFMTGHATKMPFSCSVCNKAFAYKSKLNEHTLVHTREKPFSCSLCRKGFALKGSLTRHMLVHTGEKPFSCSVCNKDFARRSLVKEHMLVHTREKPFSCSVCNRGFAHKWTLKKHMFVHTGEKPFSCSVCKKGFAHKHNLENHVKSHRKEGFHPMSLE